MDTGRYLEIPSHQVSVFNGFREYCKFIQSFHAFSAFVGFKSPKHACRIGPFFESGVQNVFLQFLTYLLK